MKAWWRKVMMVVSVTASAAMLLSACAENTATDNARGAAAAAGYPEQEIQYIVPFSPGGGVDLVARATAEYVGQKWNQTIVVVNKPGGGGAVGAQFALKQSPNDGYTVLADNNSSTSMLTAGSSTPPVQNDDRLFAARIVEDAPAFAVAADAPWKDFKEFSDWVKANPEQLTWTSVGKAGFSSFVMAEWMEAIGADFAKTRMITTKGASESAPMVAGGHAVLAIHTVSELYPLAKAGKIRLLAVQADERSPYFPEVPTAAEQGVEGLTIRWWTGLSLPAGTPDGIRQKWEETIAEMVKDPEFIDKLENMKMKASYADSSAFREEITQETEYLKEMAQTHGMRTE